LQAEWGCKCARVLKNKNKLKLCVHYFHIRTFIHTNTRIAKAHTLILKHIYTPQMIRQLLSSSKALIYFFITQLWKHRMHQSSQNEYVAPMAETTWQLLKMDLTQIINQATWVVDRMNIWAINVYNQLSINQYMCDTDYQSINQSINQSIS
jgi:hypothetical protein